MHAAKSIKEFVLEEVPGVTSASDALVRFPCPECSTSEESPGITQVGVSASGDALFTVCPVCQHSLAKREISLQGHPEEDVLTLIQDKVPVRFSTAQEEGVWMVEDRSTHSTLPLKVHGSLDAQETAWRLNMEWLQRIREKETKQARLPNGEVITLEKGARGGELVTLSDEVGFAGVFWLSDSPGWDGVWSLEKARTTAARMNGVYQDEV